MRVFATALLMLAAVPSIADDKAELKSIAGTWVPEKFEIEGSDMTEKFNSVVLEMDGEKYTVTVGTLTDKGTVSIDSSKTPKHLDVTGTEGVNAGKKYLCIYEIKDGKLTICYSMDDKNRPTKFETAKDSKTMLAVYTVKK
jgi:uncharacterized protein (TIGR03067 family)